MADDPTQRARSLIEVYRTKLATPESFEDLRFNMQQELREIENSFGSVDEALKLISDGVGGGEDGKDGTNGKDGAPGRGVQVYKQSGDPKAQGAQAGDIWFVTGF